MQSNNVKPLVSIIMNCYNGEKYLYESISTIINQTYKNWELIFWDNLSTDNSKEILEKFTDERIKYFKSTKFTNLYEARNLAINKSLGEYIAFLDTDDIWENEKLEKQLDFINKNKKFQVVFSNHYILKEFKKIKTLRHKSKLPSGEITQSLLDYYSLGILTVLLSKNIFNHYKFDNNYSIIGDFDFFINLSKKFKIGSINKPLATYRIHKSNYSIEKIDKHVGELRAWIKKNEKTLKLEGFNLTKQKFFLFKLIIKSLFRKFLNF